MKEEGRRLRRLGGYSWVLVAALGLRWLGQTARGDLDPKVWREERPDPWPGQRLGEIWGPSVLRTQEQGWHLGP